MKIEKITQKDFLEVESLISKEFPYTGVTFNKISDRVKRSTVHVFTIHEKNEFIGFIDLSLLEGVGMLNGFGVKKKFRHKGFGQKLLEFGVDFLKESNAHKIRLLVKKENLIAKKMYEKAGFKFVRVHPKKISGAVVEEMELKDKNALEKFVERFVS